MTGDPRAWTWLGSGAVVGAMAVAAALHAGARPGAGTRPLLLGAGGWAGTVALKLAATVPVGLALLLLWGEDSPLPARMAANGLLTGVFEVGGTWLLVRSTRLRDASWNGALAFGVSFGCTEAVVLAIGAGMVGLAGFADPASMPPESARALAETLADEVRPWTFAWERAIAVPVHALCCVLAVLAVRARRWGPLGAAFLLKTVGDAVPSEGEIPQPVLEGVYGALGLISLALLPSVKARFAALDPASLPPAPPSPGPPGGGSRGNATA